METLANGSGCQVVWTVSNPAEILPFVAPGPRRAGRIAVSPDAGIRDCIEIPLPVNGVPENLLTTTNI